MASVFIHRRSIINQRYREYEQVNGATANRLMDEVERLECIHQKAINALKPFAKMDREECDLAEIACSRGTASDLTLLRSADFRLAREVYDEFLRVQTKADD